MGQKSAVFDSDGQIVGLYDSIDSAPPVDAENLIMLTDVQWAACASQHGQWRVVNGALVGVPGPTAEELLASAKNAQIAAVSAACEAEIVAGFASSALGTSHVYPSSDTDQRNLLNATLAAQGQPASWSALLWCSVGAPAVWGFTSHTASQVQQVNSDFLAFRLAAQNKYAGLLSEIQSATTIAAVEANTW